MNSRATYAHSCISPYSKSFNSQFCLHRIFLDKIFSMDFYCLSPCHRFRMASFSCQVFRSFFASVSCWLFLWYLRGFADAQLLLRVHRPMILLQIRNRRATHQSSDCRILTGKRKSHWKLDLLSPNTTWQWVCTLEAKAHYCVNLYWTRYTRCDRQRPHWDG